MQRSSPEASAGFSRFDASSEDPVVAPAPPSLVGVYTNPADPRASHVALYRIDAYTRDFKSNIEIAEWRFFAPDALPGDAVDNPLNPTWTSTGSLPPAAQPSDLWGAIVVEIPGEHRFFVLGGNTYPTGSTVADVYFYSVETGVWTPVTAPGTSVVTGQLTGPTVGSSTVTVSRVTLPVLVTTKL